MPFDILTSRKARDSERSVGIELSTRDMPAKPQQYHVQILRNEWVLFSFALVHQITKLEDGSILHRVTGHKADFAAGVHRACNSFADFASEHELFTYLYDGLERLLRESEFRVAINFNQKLEFELL